MLHDSVFKREKSDFYDVLPIHTILLDIFLPSSTTCRTRPTVANKFTSITRDVAILDFTSYSGASKKITQT